MKKMGVLGGTFDPVHNGHIAIANEALSRPGLDRVLFVPASHQPLKDRVDIAPAVHRLNMVALAIEGNSRFELSTIEIDRALSYTVDTLHVLEQQYRGKADLYFILGWDSLVEMPRWKTPQQIIKLCKIIAFTRSTVITPDLGQLEKKIPGITDRLILVDIPPIDISSTDIRLRIKQGMPIHGMVPPKVEEYIKQNDLYK